jgi:hypothetical protein
MFIKNLKETNNMTKIKKNWKIIAIVTTVIGIILGIAMMFWDEIENMYYNIKKK